MVRNLKPSILHYNAIIDKVKVTEYFMCNINLLEISARQLSVGGHFDLLVRSRVLIKLRDEKFFCIGRVIQNDSRQIML